MRIFRILFYSILVHSIQAQTASYTFQVNQTCTSCCSASACVNFTFFCATPPMQYALITPTTSTPAYTVNNCFDNLCNGNYTILISGITNTETCLICSISVVYPSSSSINEITFLRNHLNVYPVPANNELNLNFTIDVADRFKTLSIFNSLGQLLREEEIKFINQTAIVKTANLTNGVYFICLTDQQGFSINKRFLITK